MSDAEKRLLAALMDQHGSPEVVRSERGLVEWHERAPRYIARIRQAIAADPSLLSAIDPSGGWMDIASAPDGGAILIGGGEFRLRGGSARFPMGHVALIYPARGRYEDDSTEYFPTKWMYLPTPPPTSVARSEECL